MTYRFYDKTERWKIDPLKFDQVNRWKLFHAVGEAWKAVRSFESAEAAMAAVAGGSTGVKGWDGTPHDAAEFAPAKWSVESW